MAEPQRVPYRAQDPGEVSTMVEALEKHCGKGHRGGGGFSVRKNTYVLASGQKVDSWKMQDWDYKKDNLPTHARGLFTTKNSKGQHEIAVRGYDKFFNHGEVRSTEWENVATSTRGPYELSVKENGCIIFISGMEDGSLIVCSKHSTGGRGEPEKAHSVWGEKWIAKQMRSLGKTEKDLARQLREMNATAVAELCDDEFEEHVLAYRPEEAGLYLHGINLNLPDFATYPGHLVDQFADAWGFKKVMYVMENDINTVKMFLDGVAETGSYAGRETEGFVIRCQRREGPMGPWQDWFFKYKFDEPYLMYRQWRECTKAVIAGRVPKMKKHKLITEKYLQYARKRLAQDRNLGRNYNQNHGIIALRDDFLQEQGVTGAEVIQQELARGDEVSAVTNDVLLVPVATIGCGKTTLAIALVKLFGWGHFQNDNVTVQKGRPQAFAREICAQLAAYPVVIADRNNHQKRERDQLITDVSRVISKPTFVALHYVHDKANMEGIRAAMRERVLSRGDNHQTIQAQSDPNKIIGIMEGFLDRFQPVDADNAPDSDFDLVVDLNPQLSSRDNLETVVSKLYNDYPKLFKGEMPTASELDQAIEEALNDYKPDLKVDLSKTFGQNKGKQGSDIRRDSGANNTRNTLTNVANGQSQQQSKGPKPIKPIYFSVRLPPERIRSILSTVFRNMHPEAAKLYRQMEATRRIQPEFHVTLIHAHGSAEKPELWQKLMDHWSSIFQPQWDAAVAAKKMANREPDLGKVDVLLERLVWDDRIMAFVVRLENNPSNTVVFESANKMPHITVGTANSTIPPKESNTLLERWLTAGSGGETGIREEVIKGNVVIEGKVIGVPGR